MKIVHIHSYFMDGWEYQENDLPLYQADLGHTVFFITSCINRYSNYRYKQGYYKSNGIEIIRLKEKYEFKQRYVWLSGLYAAITEISPDYIFFHEGATNPQLLVVGRYKKNHPNVFLAIDNHADSTNSGKYRIWKFFYINIFLRIINMISNKAVNIVYGVTKGRCRYAREELGCDKNKIKLLPIGIKECVSENTVSKGKTLFICSGGKISSNKGYANMLNAINDLMREGLDIKLYLFGTIEDISITSRLNNMSNVFYLGWKSSFEINEIFHNSHMALWPLLHTTLIEKALGCGIPVLMRRYDATEHLIEGSDFYLNHGTTKEIHDKIKEIYNSQEYRKQVITHIKKIAKMYKYEEIARMSIDGEGYGNVWEQRN